MLEGTFLTAEDLADDAYDLVAAMLLGNLQVLDVVSASGIRVAGLPSTYPLDGKGNFIRHSACQEVSIKAHAEELNGVEAPAAVRASHDCLEFAWWPEHLAAIPYGDRLKYGLWRSELIVDALELFDSGD